MHSSRIVIRSPQVCRIVKAPAAARSMSLFSAPPFFPRVFPAPSSAFGHDIAPLFRMMDDFSFTSPSSRTLDHFTAQLQQLQHHQQPQPRPFVPRFDVREIDGAYELRGELPGVQNKDLDVEFTDAQTLVIRGRTESEATAGNAETVATSAPAVEPAATQPQTQTADATAAAVDNSDAVSIHSSSSYQKPTVEEEDGVLVTAPESTSTSTSTSSTAPAEAIPTPTTTPTPSVTQQQQQSSAASPRYHLTERTTGTFQRVFTFPARVDQEGVRASLQNGVLSVVVPKAVVRGPRRIVVE